MTSILISILLAISLSSVSNAQRGLPGNRHQLEVDLIDKFYLSTSVDDQGNIDTGSARFSASRGSHFKIERKIDNKYFVVRFTKIRTKELAGKGVNHVKKNEQYIIESMDLKDHYFRFKRGPSFGVLIVPYKLRGGSNTITGNSTIGPFMGYSIEDYSITLNFVTFVGLTSISLNNLNSDDVENRFGLTYGGGLVFGMIKNFQVGLIVGGDHLGSRLEENWIHQDKIWYSISIGFRFLN